jgi:ferritin-like metal-binding protein YciE
MNNELHKLFLDELADIHYAEKQLVKTLPKLAKAANSPELKQAFEEHLKQTETHVERIQKVFAAVDAPVKSKKCEAMEGLIQEGKDLMEEHEDSEALDAALISAAQKVEHYEIASYGCLHTWAVQMGHTKAAQILQMTLDEEKKADETLTCIAEESANLVAENAK